jgi:hypothetical protein
MTEGFIFRIDSEAKQVGTESGKENLCEIISGNKS